MSLSQDWLWSCFFPSVRVIDVSLRPIIADRFAFAFFAVNRPRSHDIARRVYYPLSIHLPTVVANHQSNEAHTSQRERKIHANNIPLPSRDDAVTRHLRESILSDVESWWHGSHELCWWRAKVLHLRGRVNTASSREMKATRTSFMSVTILTP